VGSDFQKNPSEDTDYYKLTIIYSVNTFVLLTLQKIFISFINIFINIIIKANNIPLIY